MMVLGRPIWNAMEEFLPARAGSVLEDSLEKEQKAEDQAAVSKVEEVVTTAENADATGVGGIFSQLLALESTVEFNGDVLNGVIKSLVFAVVVTWIAVFKGYDCLPTSEGISKATTETVVHASLTVLGLDFILTALMFGIE